MTNETAKEKAPPKEGLQHAVVKPNCTTAYANGKHLTK